MTNLMKFIMLLMMVLLLLLVRRLLWWRRRLEATLMIPDNIKSIFSQRKVLF